jgi:hypothetical protein
MNLSKKNVLVWDAAGLGIEHALRISKDVSKVWYYTPWQTGFPVFESYAHGCGLGEIEKVLHFFDYVDKADLIYFTDTGQGDLAHFLRTKGHRVFGAGLGERLESERFKARKLQKKIGLPSQGTVEVKGVSALREFLITNSNRYVKFDIFRGSLESFYARDFKSVEILIDELEVGFGPLKEEYSFIVEEAVDGAIEIGADGFFNGKKFLDTSLWGIEAGIAYVGTYAPIPNVLKNTANKFTPVLSKLDYRGAFSTEERTRDGKKSYLVDITARYPYSLSLIYTESIKNYSEVIWKVASGEEVDIIPRFKYAVCAPVESPHAEKYWLRLIFPEKMRHKIKLHQFCKSGDYYYCVKGNKNGALLVSLGNDLDKCITDIESTANEISAHELSKDTIRPLRNIQEQLKELNELGIKF